MALTETEVQLAAEIKRRIVELGINQKIVARGTGILESSISLFMRQKQALPLKSLVKICNFLDIGEIRIWGVKAQTRQIASLDDVEREHISQALFATGNNVKKASELLGISRLTLYNKIKRYGMNIREKH